MLTALRPRVATTHLRAARALSATAAAKGKFAPFDWQDPLKMQSLLTEDEQAIHEVARNYAQEKLVPRVLKGWRTVRPSRGGADGTGGAGPEYPQGDGRARLAGADY